MMDLARYARIGLAVSISIMVTGVLVFHGSNKAAMQAVAMVGLFTGLGVAMFLEGRDRKRRTGRRQ
jgi:hypothetical protein